MIERAKSDYLPSMPLMEKQILELIYKVGTIKTNQIIRMMNLKEEEKPSFMYFINDLYNVKERISITDDGYVRVPENKDINRSKTECLWEIIHNIDHIDLDLFEKAENPADYFYTYDYKRTICDTFIDIDTMYKIQLLQERYYARQIAYDNNNQEDVDNGLMNILVVNDLNVAQAIINRYEITMPCRICFVDHSGDGNVPAVNYYSAN